jgi:hypothetical protein
MTAAKVLADAENPLPREKILQPEPFDIIK